MSLRAEHELHQRRRGRNVGVGLMLASFVVLILALTVVKVTRDNFQLPEIEEAQ
ncbi:MAG: cytochrome C oxidase assembly protein [Pseudomonadota bacterium]